MRHVECLVIGGGQAGLAMSRCLTARGIDHVVVERGRVGERWRSERWDSLRLLTPRWQSRLHGFEMQGASAGADPDGFMSRDELIEYLDHYARTLSAPLLTDTEVLSVRALGDRYEVVTSRRRFATASVVIATGACAVPLVPDAAAALSPDIEQVVPTRYRSAGSLREGGVLVVGPSATGLQLAKEIRESGRRVTLAVGRHVRLPRRYRGRDLIWWMDRLGVLDEDFRQVPHLAAARRQPSLQLVGSPDHRSLDLGVLQQMGVQLVGRLVDATGTRVTLGAELADEMEAADRRMTRLLDRIDAHVSEAGLTVEAGVRPAPLVAPAAPRHLELAAEGFETVLWATGYRRSYPWLHLPVVDDRGELRHDGGITDAPGVVALGLPFMRRRKSTYVGGVGDDAEALADHLERHLAARATRAA